MEVRPIKPEENDIRQDPDNRFMFRRTSEKRKRKRGRSIRQCTVMPTKHIKQAVALTTPARCSCFDLIPHQVIFDGTGKMGGSECPASGRKRKKFIRNIFEYAMKEMYEDGYVFSYLYPFSHVYYRKFGYELNMTTVITAS